MASHYYRSNNSRVWNNGDYGHTGLVKIKPKENYRLLGTYPVITLDKTKVYEGVIATNQPDYKKKGLVFCGDILLNKKEYTIIEKRDQ